MSETSWVTEVLQDTFSFRWTVKDGNKLSELRAGLESPVFTGGEFRKHSWKVIIVILDPYRNCDITYDLQLVEIDKNSKRTEISAKFDMAISSGNDDVTCYGYGRFSVGSISRAKENGRVSNGSILRAEDSDLDSEAESVIDDQPNIQDKKEIIISCKILFEGEHVHRNESGFQIGVGDTIVSQQPVLTADDFKRLLETSEGADVIIHVAMESFMAHTLILFSRSSVFKRILQANMTDSKLDVIKIDDFSADIVKGMLDFVYGQPIGLTEENTLQYLRLADTFDLKELKQFAGIKFLRDYLKVGNTIDALLIADMCNAPDFKEGLLEYLKLNKKAVMETVQFEKLLETNQKLFIEMCRM